MRGHHPSAAVACMPNGCALQQVCVSVLACPGQHLPCTWLLPATPSPCIHASWSPGPPCQLLAFCCCCCSRCCSVSPSSTLDASAPSIQGSRCRQLRLATGRGIELRMRSTFAAACVLRARSGECRLRRAVTAMLQQLLACRVAHASMNMLRQVCRRDQARQWALSISGDVNNATCTTQRQYAWIE